MIPLPTIDVFFQRLPLQVSVCENGVWKFFGGFEDLEFLNEDGELKPKLEAIFKSWT